MYEGICKICNDKQTDHNCTINGRWKIGTHGIDNTGEDRFSMKICQTCFDRLQGMD